MNSFFFLTSSWSIFEDNKAPGSVDKSQASVPPSPVFNAVNFPSNVLININLSQIKSNISIVIKN